MCDKIARTHPPWWFRLAPSRRGGASVHYWNSLFFTFLGWTDMRSERRVCLGMIRILIVSWIFLFFWKAVWKLVRNERQAHYIFCFKNVSFTAIFTLQCYFIYRVEKYPSITYPYSVNSIKNVTEQKYLKNSFCSKATIDGISYVLKTVDNYSVITPHRYSNH